MGQRLWDGETGKPIGAVGAPLEGHAGSFRILTFSPDGKRIVTAASDAYLDYTARLWDAETGKPIGDPLKHAGPVWSAAYSPDGRRIVTASDGILDNDKTVRLWKIFATTQELMTYAKTLAPRCLTAARRSAFSCPPDPGE
jgi:WD40 repeat protein